MKNVLDLRFLFPAVLLSLSLMILGCGQKAPAPAPATESSTRTETAASKIEAPSPETQTVPPAVSVTNAEDPSGKSTTWSSTDEDGSTSTITVTENEDGAVMNVSTDEEDMQIKIGALAGVSDNFPKDIPLVEGFAVESAMNIGDSTFTLSGTMESAYEDVAAFYRKETVAQGWKEISHMAQAGEEAMTLLNYEKDGRSLAVVVAKTEDTVRLSLTTAYEDEN
jgi:hypothetical protein